MRIMLRPPHTHTLWPASVVIRCQKLQELACWVPQPCSSSTFHCLGLCDKKWEEDSDPANSWRTYFCEKELEKKVGRGVEQVNLKISLIRCLTNTKPPRDPEAACSIPGFQILRSSYSRPKFGRLQAFTYGVVSVDEEPRSCQRGTDTQHQNLGFLNAPTSLSCGRGTAGSWECSPHTW